MAEVQQQQELRDVLQAAQTALEEGRPQESIAACQHVLRHFPDAITALRLLGEACLEAGRSDEAARAFEKALSIDPHNVLARVGLGVIAEDRGEDERAIGQFRLAWEIEPSLPQLRGELVRLYRKRYGAGGRLRLTRVALANLHRRNDELLRAISQLRQLHQEDPNRPEIILGLAEALWRHDEDEDAGFLCQTLLAERPRTARALLILASIQGDNGAVAEQGVDELLATARGYDPDLTLTGELINLRPSETLLAFASDVPTVPAFDPATAPIGGSDELLSQGVAGQATPMTRWEDIASGLTTETSNIRSATNLGVVNGVPTAVASGNDDVDDLFAAIDRELAIANEHGTGTLPEIPPFDPSEALEPAGADWQDPDEDTMMPSPDEPSAVERLTANWDNIDNELAAARPTDDAPLGMTGMLSALGDLEEDLVPFDVDRASEEEEETISFDPSKFSLPPLDGEDDDDLDIALETDELQDEIAPFSLESAGVRRKTSGLSFTDLVGKQDSVLPSTTGRREAAPDAEQEAVAAAASIFATRELSSLPEDQLLELHASMPDTNTLADQHDTVPDTSPIVEPARRGAEEDTVIAVPAEQPLVLAEAEDELVVAGQSDVAAAVEPVQEAATEDASRASSSTADLDKLLSTNSPRMVAPPPTDNYPVDATRPLLADEALLLGIAATSPSDEDHLVSKLPVAPAEDEEPGMDKLFNRLRHRKQERIQTGDLLVNRRLQSSGTPGADTGEIAGPIGPPKKQERRLKGAGTAAEQPAMAQETDAAAMSDAADDEALPSWAVTVPDADEVPPAGDTADFLAAIASEDTASAAGEVLLPVNTADDVAVDDTWLTTLVDDDTAVSSDWSDAPSDVSLAEAVPPAHGAAEAPEMEQSFAELLGDDSVVSSPAAQPRADAPTWERSLPGASFDDMPEQPAPPSSPWAVTSASDEMPHWGHEAVDAPLVAAAPINGHHKDPQDSVVMRVRTPAMPGGSRPLTRETVKPARPIPRQTEQLATLNTMVAAQPDNHFARLTLAVAYVSARQPEQALTEYRRLIKESEELVPEVVERLKEMIADGDAPSRTHRVLGDAYMKLGQFDLAMAEFQRALTTRPRAAK